jgi:hypothetical protein
LFFQETCFCSKLFQSKNLKHEDKILIYLSQQSILPPPKKKIVHGIVTSGVLRIQGKLFRRILPNDARSIEPGPQKAIESEDGEPDASSPPICTIVIEPNIPGPEFEGMRIKRLREWGPSAEEPQRASSEDAEDEDENDLEGAADWSVAKTMAWSEGKV